MSGRNLPGSAPGGVGHDDDVERGVGADIGGHGVGADTGGHGIGAYTGDGRSFLARHGRKIALALMSLLMLGVAVKVAGIDGVMERLASYSPRTLALATGLLLVNQWLGSLRFHVLARAMGVNQGVWRAHVINTYSLVGGVFLFNFLGQSVTRSGMFKMENKGGALHGFVTTAVERAQSLILMVVMLIALMLRYTDGISLHQGHVNAVLTLVVMVCMVAAMVFRWGLGRHRWTYLARLVNGRFLAVALVSTLLTAAMLGTMLSAYVVLARELLPGVDWTLLPLPASASMLGAAVPIGFAGWGVRELTASQAFTYVGMDPAVGVGMALAVGGLSLVALLINAVTVTVPHRDRSARPPVDQRLGSGRQYLRFLSWALPILCVALLAFRVPLPTRTGFANFNFADPFVLVAAGLFLLGAWGAIGRTWRFKGMWMACGGLVLGVGLSFLMGWERHGVLDWALFNRLLGVGILLSMLVAGALVTNTLGRAGTVMVARSYVVSLATVLVFEIVIRSLEGGNPMSLLPWNGLTYSGFSGGSVAFAYQLSLALILCLSGLPLFSGPRGQWVAHALAGVVLVGLWRTGSISALAAMVVILVVLALTRRYSVPRLAMMVALTVVVVNLLGLIGSWSGSSLVLPLAAPPIPDWLPRAWDGEGLGSVRVAMDMWRDHPLFGAGLGSFLADRLDAGLEPMVIRGAFAWMLGEMGLVGSLLFLAPVVVVVIGFLRDRFRKPAVERDTLDSRLALACLCVVFLTFAMSIVHDMAYQRDFWLLLGAFAASSGTLSGSFRRTTARRSGAGAEASSVDPSPEGGK